MHVFDPPMGFVLVYCRRTHEPFNRDRNARRCRFVVVLPPEPQPLSDPPPLCVREIFQYPKRENFNPGSICSAEKLIKKSEHNVTPRLVIGLRGLIAENTKHTELFCLCDLCGEISAAAC